MQQEALPEGVKIIPIKMLQDQRGFFSEIHRREWPIDSDILQWTVSFSLENVLRGMHVHHRHTDYLMVVRGHMTLCLHDIRPNSATRFLTSTLELLEDHLRAILIPPGVVHGFYFNKESFIINGVSHYWDKRDEIACMWNSPEFKMPWPSENPILSSRDTSAHSYQEMLDIYQQCIAVGVL